MKNRHIKSIVKRKICVVITARPSYSRVKSVLQAINENDQLETLQGAIKFAGLLNSTIGNINKQIESDVQKHLDLSNVQMPKLEIEKQLLKLDENFQPSVKSKISGESI